MPNENPHHYLEHQVKSGYVQVVHEHMTIRAYSSEPILIGKTSSIVLIHDWWGLNEVVRGFAHHFAQIGFRVLVPDLFSGQLATTVKEAKMLVSQIDDHSYDKVHAVLDVVENHTRSNHRVAAIGVGLGGGFAFHAAIHRKNLEAAIAISGFPQVYFGQFKKAETPILAIYGAKDPFIKLDAMQKLRKELNSRPDVGHEVHIVDNASHITIEGDGGTENNAVKMKMRQLMYTFIDKHLREAKY